MLVVLAAAAHAQPDCTVLQPQHPREQSALIETPGRYCLEADFAQPKLIDLHDMRPRGLDSMLTLWSGEVDVNLCSHALRSDGGVGAIVKSYSGKLDHVRIHDGTLSARKGNDGVRIVGLGGAITSFIVGLLSDKEEYFQEYPERRGKPGEDAWIEAEITKALQALPATPADYPSRRLVLENLTIRVERYAAVLQGADTVIRNCTIEVDGHTALFLYGPRALIEGNTLIVNGEDTALEADAPIRLHQAEGTVIRGNKIVIKRPAPSRAAITLVQSPDVVAEDNRIYGAESLAKTFDEASSVRDEGNDLRSAWRRFFERQ
jgi:hypothetical protein